MKIRDFSFNLPPEQIAQHPPEVRGTARLMVLDRQTGQVVITSYSIHYTKLYDILFSGHTVKPTHSRRRGFPYRPKSEKPLPG